MIVDADVHISPIDEGNSITADDLLREMDRAGVDRAVVWPHPPYRRTIDESNDYIHKSATQHPDRLIPFGWVDPRLGVATAINSVTRCIESYGFHGVKLNGALNNYYIDDPSIALPVIEEVRRLGGALAFHVGTDAFEFTHPFRVGKIARQYPELRILMVHMGGVGFADMTDAAIEIAGQHPNLMLVGSAVRTAPIIKAICTLGPERVCFGSDLPYELMYVELARYQAFLAEEFDETTAHDVLCQNIVRFLHLDS